VERPKTERKKTDKADKAPEFVSAFEAPPLMDEPPEMSGGYLYLGEDYE
jgi:hypothetical protein